jgi:hypothetical protein
MDLSTINFESITFNAALIIAVVVLWRTLNDEREKRDEMYTKLSEDTSKTLSEFAIAMRAQSDSITTMHATLINRVLDDTKSTPPKDRDARIAMTLNGAAGD